MLDTAALAAGRAAAPDDERFLSQVGAGDYGPDTEARLRELEVEAGRSAAVLADALLRPDDEHGFFDEGWRRGGNGEHSEPREYEFQVPATVTVKVLSRSKSGARAALVAGTEFALHARVENSGFDVHISGIRVDERPTFGTVQD